VAQPLRVRWAVASWRREGTLGRRAERGDTDTPHGLKPDGVSG
jgi:hypothetical protein